MTDMPKQLFIDLETTGLKAEKFEKDPQKRERELIHGVHQISGVVRIDGEETGKFDYNVRPFPEDTIDPEAIAVSGLEPEDLESEEYRDPEDLFDQFLDMLDQYVDRYDKSDKFFLLAYNARFDTDFLRQWFLKADAERGKYFGAWFFTPSIDIMSLAAYALAEQRPGMDNFRLETVCAHLGIPVDRERIHDSLYDVELSIEVWERINELLDGSGLAEDL